MVNLREWVLNNLIDCVNHKIFAKEYASILATNYLLKGILNQEDLQTFDEATKESEPTVEENATVEETENQSENLTENTEDEEPVEDTEENIEESEVQE